MNRKIVFTALVGSHNYNLQTETSDRDFKKFIVPNFSDLYHERKFSKSIITDEEDIEHHDIRKLSQLLWKSNVNFVETLFSIEYKDCDNWLFNYLYANREDIAAMNLPYLFDACAGMFNKEKRIFYRDIFSNNKGSKLSACKHASQALRIVDFLHRYYLNGFGSFKSAIWYDESDSNRNFLLDVKTGKVSNIESYFNNAEQSIQKLKEVYKERNPNEDLKEDIELKIKEYVEESIYEETKERRTY